MSETPAEPAANEPSTAPTAPSAEDVDLFGVVLPDQTSDDLGGDDWREDADRDRDDDLRADVPPHY